mmetsp:Transcript_8233/g.24753  ORF Transcript_8233/g.24753 Transcript_8233/m.24753 type:complete len:133 (+) Transcript_8233:165-563(+)
MIVMREASCMEVGARSGVRSGVSVGVLTCVLNGAQALSGSHPMMMSQVATHALTTGVEWGATIGVFYGSKCAMTHSRGRDDVFNSAISGAFAGGLLSAVKSGSYWRYNLAGIRSATAIGAALGTAHYLIGGL